jgi:hypothetical protein
LIKVLINLSSIMNEQSYLEQYCNANITNIRYGHGAFRSKILYAQIRGANGKLLMSADLAYCTKRMEEAAAYFAEVDQIIPCYRTSHRHWKRAVQSLETHAITAESIARTLQTLAIAREIFP